MPTTRIIGTIISLAMFFAYSPVKAAGNSNAGLLSAQLISNGHSFNLPVQARLSNARPAPYNQKLVIAAYNKNLYLSSGAQALKLSAAASGINEQIISNGITVDAIAATGNTNVAKLNLKLTVTDANNHETTLLQIDVSKLQTSSSYDLVFPSFITTAGAASFGNITVSGQLIAGTSSAPVSYSGSPDVNYPLYSSPDLTITLNNQLVELLISCTIGSVGCEDTPVSISTQAVNINFNNANIAGKLFTGQIVIGETRAE